MSKLAKALTAAAGNAGGEALYAEDVFSTYLYTGTGSARTITNNIDLDGEGGLVWIKNRDTTAFHNLHDTERGVGTYLKSHTTDAEVTDSDEVTAFNSNGFSLGGGTKSNSVDGSDYASWTFRKAEKFFDVVEYSGNGVAGRQIAHNLNSDVGFLIIKRTDSAESWLCWHNSFNGTTSIELNSTGAEFTSSSYWNSTTPTSTHFTVSAHAGVNNSSGTYVAYLFASDAGGFGDDGSESIIKCGSFTGNTTVDLGFEPQWVMLKRADGVGDWNLLDVMRGMPNSTSSQTNALLANSSGAEIAGFNNVYPTSTGLYTNGLASSTYIYIAIRRPMKTPESGTEVFAIDTADGSTLPQYKAGFVIDAALRVNNITATHNNFLYSRLTQGKYLVTESTNAEGSSTAFPFDYMNGYCNLTSVDSNNYSWMFKRATGFFDVVAYTGNGSARTIDHNLGVAPELMIVKSRSSTGNWAVYNAISGAHRWIKLNENDGLQTEATPSIWNDTEPTASVFSLCASTASDASTVNGSGTTYIAYLFASVDGVSKVGSYTGTGSTPLNVDCGFSSGARFVLIKRVDGNGGWYVLDSTRGIVAGNDPLLQLSSTAAEVTTNDYIDPYPSGFTVSNTFTGFNASGGTYIFLAIA